TPAMLGGATVLLALSWAVGRLAPARRHRHGSGRRRPSPPRPGRVARRIAGAALVLGAAYMGLVEWRLHALVTRPGPGRGLSVLYWNAPQRPRQVAEQILSYQA